MNTLELKKYLLDPSCKSDLMEDQLHSLIEQYPFCQHLRWKAWRNSKSELDSKNDVLLSQAATYSKDRTLLFSQNLLDTNSTPDIVEELEVEAIKVAIEKVEISESATAIQAATSTLVKNKTDLQEEVHYFEIPDRKVEGLEWKREWPGPTNMAKKDKHKNKDLRLKEELGLGNKSKSEPDVNELKAFIEKPKTSKPTAPPAVPPTAEPPIATKSNEKKSPNRPSPKGNFDSWAKHVKKSKGEKPVVADEIAEVTEKIKPKKATKEKKKHKRKRVKQFAAKSVKNNSSLISATLAELLMRQGHYEESMAMYEKLMLLIPEKSGFFADQIKKIKKL